MQIEFLFFTEKTHFRKGFSVSFYSTLFFSLSLFIETTVQ